MNPAGIAGVPKHTLKTRFLRGWAKKTFAAKNGLPKKHKDQELRK